VFFCSLFRFVICLAKENREKDIVKLELTTTCP
jgi:hypothetical protein